VVDVGTIDAKCGMGSPGTQMWGKGLARRSKQNKLLRFIEIRRERDFLGDHLKPYQVRVTCEFYDMSGPRTTFETTVGVTFIKPVLSHYSPSDTGTKTPSF
jgi:hypothetical protein